MSIGQDLLNVPMGDMIRQMAMAIADAQFQLDRSSMHVAQFLSGDGFTFTAENGTQQTAEGVKVSFGGQQLSMMELGFTPTFYQFVDTLIEVRIAVNVHRTSESLTQRKGTERTIRPYGWFFGYTVTTTPVDASYSSKYNYSAEGSSVLRTKLVPVPPPAALTDRIRALMEAQTQEQTQSNE